MKYLITILTLLFAVTVSNASYWWYPCNAEGFPHWLFLYRDNEHIGGYNRKTQVYLPVIDAHKNTWGSPCQPPYPVPKGLKDYSEPTQDYGVDYKKIGGGYSFNGEPISKKAAYALVQDKTIVDDSHKLWITSVGLHNKNKIEQDLQEFNDDIIVADYPEDHWHVDGLFQRGVYLQRPSGKVVAYSENYPGSQLLAAALRKNNPDYDPRMNPGFDDYGWSFDIKNVHIGVWISLGVLLVLFFLTKRNEQNA